jgi:hypothetical protein
MRPPTSNVARDSAGRCECGGDAWQVSTTAAGGFATTSVRRFVGRAERKNEEQLRQISSDKKITEKEENDKERRNEI